MRASTTNSLLIVIAAVLLLISIPLIVKGVRDSYLKGVTESDIEEISINYDKNEEVDVSSYFEDYVSEPDSEDSYLRNDPFRDICSQIEAEEGTVIVYSHVVCFK